MPETEPPAAVMRRQGGLDPRSKILLVLVCSIAVMSPGGLRFVPFVLLVAVILALSERAWTRALGLMATATVMGVLGWMLPLWWPNAFTAIVALACTYLIRFAAAIGVGMHLIGTTSPTQLAAAFRAWRIPRPISVTLAVMLRFFPVVSSEAASVLDAMRLRGLAGASGLLRHPVLTLERFTVPMIAASLRASEDLSASAILRGLGSHRIPTAMHPPRLGNADLILVLVVAVLVTAALILPAPLT
ncbi:energy-coupling factor transporter transmembrane component T [Microbacterium murale]|uniref:Energy-coupling factor transporter transmembrane protein EcfT n=1 Tax=Microbacterium murale TaxID=1081040 RepID=A0ABU0P504_9MICO|nr:energy-coupling factor transporter transmembrane component T [Microbacterium murale]MDQ0642027.1 energy-coupling factor transporter transmembrane protein EcfT [Microbacterium murale]